MRSLLPFAVAATFALPAMAQSVTRSAHPQETLQNGNGNLAPLGVISNGALAEARTMILVPARELPSAPCQLTAIEVHCQSAVTIDYATLSIGCAPTTATGLTLAFAANYSLPPWPALQATNLQVNYTSGWTRIAFPAPYPHDGASGLLIDIQKIVQPGASGFPFATMSTSSSPPRNDRPPMAYAFGGAGSGAANAAVGSTYGNSIAYRLEWNGSPTMRHRSDVGSSGNQYNLGGSVTVSFHGQPGQLYVMAAATGYLPGDVPIPGFGGALRLASPVTFASGLLGLSGEDSVTYSIPPTPGLVGFFIAYQGAAFDLATQGVTFTNCSDHFVNP